MKKAAKLSFGLVLSLAIVVSVFLHWRYPVYNEQQVRIAIERNIPIGTSQRQVIQFLDTLKPQDVYYEADDSGAAAYFPETMFYFRGWRCVAAEFNFKNGKLIDYQIRRVSI